MQEEMIGPSEGLERTLWPKAEGEAVRRRSIEAPKAEILSRRAFSAGWAVERKLAILILSPDLARNLYSLRESVGF